MKYIGEIMCLLLLFICLYIGLLCKAQILEHLQFRFSVFFIVTVVNKYRKSWKFE